MLPDLGEEEAEHVLTKLKSQALFFMGRIFLGSGCCRQSR